MATGVINKNMVLLWENPNVNVEFPAQQVTLNTSEYDFYLIEFLDTIDTPGKYSCQIIPKIATAAGSPSLLRAFASDNQTLHRGYYFNAAGIYFERSYFGSNQGNNRYCNPRRIYGIRV